MPVSQIRIAPHGPQFSRIVQGLARLMSWKKSRKEIHELIEECLRLGITTFDHADIYGDYAAQEEFGAALSEAPHLRSRMQIVTKCGVMLRSKQRPEHQLYHYDTSPRHITESLEASLKALRTDYVDLLLIHRSDPLMNADEVAGAFSALKRAGKVRYFGVSNFLPAQFELLSSRLDSPLVTNQIEYSVLHMAAQDDATLDMCQRLRISPMAWSPLAGGRLFREQSEQIVRVREMLKKVREDIDGATIDQVAVAWILHHPANPLPILGTGKLERIRNAVKAEEIALHPQQWYLIRRSSTGQDLP